MPVESVKEDNMKKRKQSTPPTKAGFDARIFDDEDTTEPASEPTEEPTKPVQPSKPATPPPRDALGSFVPPPRGTLVKDRILYIPPRVMTGMASIGCSDVDIQRCFGLDGSAWQAGLTAHPEIREALNQARAEGKRSIVKSLFNTAQSGDLRAIQFWLCNRAQEDWQSTTRMQVEHSGKVDTVPDVLRGVSDAEVAARLEAAAAELRKRAEVQPKPDELQ
jgi:hypothetical protein